MQVGALQPSTSMHLRNEATWAAPSFLSPLVGPRPSGGLLDRTDDAAVNKWTRWRANEDSAKRSRHKDPRGEVVSSGGSGDVSVLVPVYNHERFVGAALESVLTQSALPGEIICIDDGSSDRSRAVVAEIASR